MRANAELTPITGDARTIVLSLKPRWVDAIESGEKVYEFRRRVPRQPPPFPVVIYATSPRCAIVATAWVSEVRQLPPGALLEHARSGVGGEPEREVLDYFRGLQSGFALRIERFARLPAPLELSALRLLSFVPPQSFAYLDSFPRVGNILALSGRTDAG